ncbi:type II toxin-antitoxin system PemK/MazF family toxin [Vreelandella aquamarina]
MAMTFTPGRGDIISINLDPTAGHEQRGFRPCLVISDDRFNKASGMVVILPITSSEARAESPWSVPVQTKRGKKRIVGYVLASQVRTIDLMAEQRECRFESVATSECLEEAVARFQAVVIP